MKTLYTYIKESRDRLNSLPISLDEFQKLCQMEVGEIKYDMELYRSWEKKIKSKFGKNSWMNLLYYISGNYKNNAQDLYNDIINMPIDRINNLLKSGAYGSVLSYGNDKIIKWFHKLEPLRNHDRIFYNWCITNTKYKCFPKVYKLTDKFVIMEKLLTDTKESKEYNTFIKVTINYRDIVNFVDNGGPKPKFNKKYDAIWDWHVETYKGLKDMGLAEHYPGDMHSGNIGIRPKTNEVVWFDI